MTLDRYTIGIFIAGVLAGIGLVLLGRSVVDQVFIIRYLRRRRKPFAEPQPLERSR